MHSIGDCIHVIRDALVYDGDCIVLDEQAELALPRKFVELLRGRQARLRAVSRRSAATLHEAQ
jgi:hypothetical protein